MKLEDNKKCFVCGSENKHGLGLKFVIDENNIMQTEFVPLEQHQGFKGIMHGGLIGLILDEVVVNLAWKLGKNAVSAELNIRLKRTLTYDQGREMAQHKLFSKETEIEVYFAHPHSPWERGTNENTNGLIRQYFPKGTDFSKISKDRLKEVQDELNDRPRETLNWYTPHEKFCEVLR